jgi:hypothetical protein
VATLEDVRRVVAPLPRAYEAHVRDYVKFRVGRIVFASVSPDESLLGFGYPRDAREALIASDPGTFLLPLPSDMRYQWVRARLPVLDAEQLEELVIDAWAMCVPKFLRAQYLP